MRHFLDAVFVTIGCLSAILLLCFNADQCFAQSHQPSAVQVDEIAATKLAQLWEFHALDTSASLRGLHVFDAKNIWASGSGGTVVCSSDAGENWRVLRIKGASELDVRDIHLIDAATVIAMTAGSPARIYRSADAGLNWKIVFEATDERVFFDSISFFDAQRGIVMSDPVDGRFVLVATEDGGRTWEPIKNAPAALSGEAGFAASGTNMTIIGKQKVLIGLGGGDVDQPRPDSRVLISSDGYQSWEAAAVPIRSHSSAGIFSIRFATEKDGVAVGGNYEDSESTGDNFAVTSDGGECWFVPSKRQPPSGFRSCVDLWVNGKQEHFVAVGPNGTDLSKDFGKSWHRVSDHGFHVIQFSPDGRVGWAAGSDGRIAKWLGVSGLPDRIEYKSGTNNLREK